MSDYWKPYEQFVPKELYTQSKAETYTMEAIKAYSGIFLLGYAEKKYYSKSKIMLKYSVMLLMLKRNGELDAIQCPDFA